MPKHDLSKQLKLQITDAQCTVKKALPEVIENHMDFFFYPRQNPTGGKPIVNRCCTLLTVLNNAVQHNQTEPSQTQHSRIDNQHATPTTGAQQCPETQEPENEKRQTDTESKEANPDQKTYIENKTTSYCQARVYHKPHGNHRTTWILHKCSARMD